MSSIDIPSIPKSLIPFDKLMEREVFKKLKDKLWFFENCLKVKDRQRQIVPFKPNKMQQEYYGKHTNRDDIVKFRQGGMTTYCLADFYHETVTTPYTTTVLAAHDAHTTQLCFEIVKRFYAYSPPYLQFELERNNKRELYFKELESKFMVGQAGTDDFGRANTINFLHLTEVAHYKDIEGFLRAILESVPRRGSRVVRETTPKGYGSYHHRLWLKNESDPEGEYTNHFFPWWYDESGEYELELNIEEKFKLELELTEEEKLLISKHGVRLEQIAWRRQAMKRLGVAFKQEYVEDSLSAFLHSGYTRFDSADVEYYTYHITPVLRTEDRWIIYKEPENGRQYIIGADPAEGLARSNFSTAVVIDHETAECVALLKRKIDPTELGREMVKMGTLYNNALLVPELNNHGHTVIREIRSLGYKHIYKSKTKLGDAKYGFTTNMQTRPLLADITNRCLQDKIFTSLPSQIVSDLQGYSEEADRDIDAYRSKLIKLDSSDDNNHFDTLMAFMIAQYIRQQKRPRASINVSKIDVPIGSRVLDLVNFVKPQVGDNIFRIY